MPGFLTTKGRRVLANGFPVIPIMPGDKSPSVRNWRDAETTPEMLSGWLSNGRANHGVGILTKWVPMVDLDVWDEDVVRQLLDFIQLRWNFPPIRIGQAPKTGIIFRSEVPFKKVSSRWYIDDKGRECHVEILGDGQQFVAFHIHPATKRPYRWIGPDTPETITRDDLDVMTQEGAQSIVAEFHRIAELRGWQLKQKSNLPARRDDDEFGLNSEPLGLSEDELRELVEKIPNDDAPYEGEGLTWLNMMAAIHHETDGSEVGRDIAWEWSDKSTKHETARFEKTWGSLGKTILVPVTARFVLKFAKEADEARLKEQIRELVSRLDFARDIDELKAVATEFRKLDLDLMDRARVISIFQKAVKAVTNNTISLREAREMVRYTPDEVETPEWLEDWCYLRHSAQFYNRKTGEMLKKEAFDAAFGRYVGVETTASLYALNTIKIPNYHMTIYLPGFEEVFSDEHGLEWINTYTESGLPRMPTSLNRKDLRNVERAEAHYWHLFEHDREIEILISQLAYIVQTGRRVKWASLVQGGEKIGKTWFAHLAAAVLGRRNVYILGPDSLQSTFNAWIDGHQFAFIEELRMHGSNRWEILDRMKPVITNDWIECHKKNITPYNIPNTVTCMAATNYADAIPLTKNDTRYFVLMSRWQETEAIDEFIRENPDYYKNIWNALLESPGAIRQWLLEYKLHSEFDPDARAPYSHGRVKMVEKAKSDDQILIEDLISEGENPLVSDDILVVHILREMIADEAGQIPGLLGSARGVRNALDALGFEPLPRVKIGDQRFYSWTKNRKLVSADVTTVAEALRKRLKNNV